MGILDILKMCGGIAVFLFGMKLMGNGLEKLSGGRTEKLLNRAAGNMFTGILLGLVVTSVIQSSSATTVIVVGLVNAKMMTLRQGISICMGANIGTTVTAWLLSLAGINSDNFFLSMFKPVNLAAVAAVVGIILLLFSKKEKRNDVGFMLLGFAVLMFGMETMSSSAHVLAESESFRNALVYFRNPILGFLTGLFVTAIIQSSSASIGMLQAIAVGAAMSGNSTLTVSVTLPIILGQNVGTCITAVLSGIGASKNAMRTAVANVYIKTIGAIAFMGAVYGLNAIFSFPFWNDTANALNIAIIHTVFNIVTTVFMIPFVGLIEKLAKLTVRGEDKVVNRDVPVLEERFLTNPHMAISQCKAAVGYMGRKAKENLKRAIGLLSKFDEDVYRETERVEDVIDLTEDALGTYLVKLANTDMNASESKEVSQLLHSVSDYERIGDHAMNIAKRGRLSDKRGLSFSESALWEVEVMYRALDTLTDVCFDAFLNDDDAKAENVEPREEAIDTLTALLKNKHVERLKKGECTVESGVIFLDLLNDFERIADHCSNIAVYVIELKKSKLDAHEYLKNIKHSSPDFLMKSENYVEQYKNMIDNPQSTFEEKAESVK